MSTRRHRPLRALPPLALALAFTASSTARAQGRAAPHPARVAPFTAIAPSVRSFAVARAGDRAVVTWVEGADVRARGTLRAALFHGLPDNAGIERVGNESVLAPNAISAAVSWDGTRGAVAYVVPFPHRGHPPHPHSRRGPPPSGPGPLEDPLGPLSISAGDIVLQLLDANGAPTGHAVTVFRENSRAYRVAIAPDGDGWLVAWTGSLSTDDEARGTVRWSRVSAAGEVRSFTSDTGFTGHVGDGLRVVPAADGRAEPWLLFTGERCVSRPDLPAHQPPTNDPSADIEGHNRPLNAQAPAHESFGPPVVCATRHVYVAAARADGTTSAIAEGPAVGTDTFSAVPIAQGGVALVVPAGERAASAVLTLVALDAHGSVTGTRAVAEAAPAEPASAHPEATPEGGNEQEGSSHGAAPSSVPPPVVPDARSIARAPVQFDAISAAGVLTLAAVSPTRARMVLGARTEGGADAEPLLLLEPGPRTFDVALAGAGDQAPWVFARTGSESDGVLMGPLVFFDALTARTHTANPETRWPGDERFRAQLLRVRAARAAYTDSEQTYMWAAARPDAASNPHIATMAQRFNSVRMRWQNACGNLGERARWLAAHGADSSINDLVRQSCDAPPEVTPPTATTAAPGAAAPAP